MKVERIVVTSRKSVMLAATGDYTAEVRLEVSLNDAEQDQNFVKELCEKLQKSADYLVDQHIEKRCSDG